MSYSILDLNGIDREVIAALKAARIRTTVKLLEVAKSAKARKALAAKTGINEKQILHLVTLADRMRVPGVGDDYAGLLQAAGVETVKELKYRNPAKLAKAMSEANKKRKLGVRLLPSEKAVGRWIEHAKKLPLKITY
jgi:DNA-binding helix-hairpin-helix protein with protein kinase domain